MLYLRLERFRIWIVFGWSSRNVRNERETLYMYDKVTESVVALDPNRNQKYRPHFCLKSR
jgi:hypothetical protein